MGLSLEEFESSMQLLRSNEGFACLRSYYDPEGLWGILALGIIEACRVPSNAILIEQLRKRLSELQSLSLLENEIFLVKRLLSAGTWQEFFALVDEIGMEVLTRFMREYIKYFLRDKLWFMAEIAQPLNAEIKPAFFFLCQDLRLEICVFDSKEDAIYTRNEFFTNSAKGGIVNLYEMQTEEGTKVGLLYTEEFLNLINGNSSINLNVFPFRATPYQDNCKSLTITQEVKLPRISKNHTYRPDPHVCILPTSTIQTLFSPVQLNSPSSIHTSQLDSPTSDSKSPEIPVSEPNSTSQYLAEAKESKQTAIPTTHHPIAMAEVPSRPGITGPPPLARPTTPIPAPPKAASSAPNSAPPKAAPPAPIPAPPKAASSAPNSAPPKAAPPAPTSAPQKAGFSTPISTPPKAALQTPIPAPPKAASSVPNSAPPKAAHAAPISPPPKAAPTAPTSAHLLMPLIVSTAGPLTAASKDPENYQTAALLIGPPMAASLDISAPKSGFPQSHPKVLRPPKEGPVKAGRFGEGVRFQLPTAVKPGEGGTVMQTLQSTADLTTTSEAPPVQQQTYKKVQRKARRDAQVPMTPAPPTMKDDGEFCSCCGRIVRTKW
eukprot:CAMPEP_0204905548 /NCGR_PEP_ID=MMETSP1397-20131031/5475_1 /ASSEMBLY_ACC=CAM_ASM_000891 /TAXON_ID=49980 /ORGANISM="Climacostomum Climacostomum virens, Strain Stock W-24" /LENGTH=602 /DNA_ID=CAMNT_0052074433 /DNA_START=700 /DNA_END=2505 /DNA_ORIENTATION=-